MIMSKIQPIKVVKGPEFSILKKKHHIFHIHVFWMHELLANKNELKR